jgi:hypothetical protein
MLIDCLKHFPFLNTFLHDPSIHSHLPFYDVNVDIFMINDIFKLL